MSSRNRRWLGFGLLATAGAGLLALTSVLNASYAFGETPDTASADPTIGLVMGPSGDPIPGPEYVDVANGLYITNPLSTSVLPFPDTTYPGVLANGLFTPENLYPLTGVKTLPLNVSVSEGVTILNDNIAANLTAGDATTVFGYSQSTVLAALEMQQLDPAGTPSNLPVQFVLIGNAMNPNGGFLERYPGLDLASIGLKFYGATPADDFATVIYTGEYDGYADFPRYPIDFLSDVNAFLGIFYVHGTYLEFTPAEIATAITLPTSGATETSYYMIPTTDLPLLDPLRSIPVVGNPLADLLQPDLTYLVNLGYGDPLYGWSTTAANVPTPAGGFLPLADVEMLPSLLVSGAAEGIHNFIGDFTGSGPDPVTLSLSSLPDPTSGTVNALADLSAALSAFAADPTVSLTDLVNTLSADASTAYGTLLATADFANFELTSIPAYEASLFLDNLSNPINAVGLVLGAETAALTLGGAFELNVLLDAAEIIADIL
jgi:hypothetical protein